LVAGALAATASARAPATQEFRLSLPPSCRRAANIAPVQTSVLVVDDDARFRALAVRILAAAGLVVGGEADTFESGWNAALALRPSGIIVDARLPDGDGVALARDLSELSWRPSVVLTSSDADVAAEFAQKQARGLAYLPKSDLPDAPLRQLLDHPWRS
jgi:DNA-binding NarL/FixJ family response regulator